MLSWSASAISQGECVVHVVLEFSNKSGRVNGPFCLECFSLAISQGGWSKLSWSSREMCQGECIVHAVLEFSSNKSRRVHGGYCRGALEQ